MNDVATLFVCSRVGGSYASLISGHDRRTAPRFGTHVRIDTLTLKKNLTHPTRGGGGLGGYLLLKIFRDRPRPNLARMCG